MAKVQVLVFCGAAMLLCLLAERIIMEPTQPSISAIEHFVNPAVSFEDVQVRRSCEGSSLTISCDIDRAIKIHNALYGRTVGASVCPHPSIRDTECVSARALSLSHVRGQCDGRSLCILYASNSVFGDPCIGTYKYLEVNYTCEQRPSLNSSDETDVRVAQFCRGRAIHIDCAENSVIKIHRVSYNRKAPGVSCNSPEIPDSVPMCRNTSALMEHVQGMCDGHRSCSEFSNKHIYNDSCAGAWKTVDVSYTCQKQRTHLPDGVTMNVGRGCEGKSLNLCCPEGDDERHLFISNAMYGRMNSSRELCPHPSIQTHNCAAADSLDVVRAICQERSSCTVPANNDIFGDPCIGTYKYLEIEYLCTKKSRVCEHSSLTLSCPRGQTIRVLDGFYGREVGPELCPHPSIKTKNCRAPSSLSIFMKRCNRQQSCTLSASNDVFGDPCVNTYKYLEVYYVCMHEV